MRILAIRHGHGETIAGRGHQRGGRSAARVAADGQRRGERRRRPTRPDSAGTSTARRRISAAPRRRAGRLARSHPPGLPRPRTAAARFLSPPRLERRQNSVRSLGSTRPRTGSNRWRSCLGFTLSARSIVSTAASRYSAAMSRGSSIGVPADFDRMVFQQAGLAGPIPGGRAETGVGREQSIRREQAEHPGNLLPGGDVLDGPQSS